MKKLRIGLLTLIMCATMTGLSVAADQEIGVQYNGDMIEFTDAAPVEKDDRVMVPFRPIFEAMGAEVSFDAETDTVTAVKDDLTVSFVIGANEVTTIKGNANAVVTAIDVAPYIDHSVGRTYIPTRFAAQALGYKVGWDSANETVVILNIDPMFKELDESMTVLNGTMKIDPYFLTEAYKQTATGKFDFTMNMAETGFATETKMTADMDMSIFAKGMNFTADVTMPMDVNVKTTIDGIETDTSMKFDLDMKMIMDNKSFYINMGEMAAQMFPDADPGKTWFKFDFSAINEIYKSMGIDLDLAELINVANYKDMTIGSLLAMVYEAMPADVTTYNSIAVSNELMLALFGDDKFKKTTDTGIDTYTLKVNTTDLKKAVDAAFAKEGLTAAEKAEIDALFSGMPNLFNMNMTIQLKDGAFYSSESSFKMEIPAMDEAIPVGITLEMTEKTSANMDSKITMKLSAGDMMNMSFEMDAKTVKTTGTPDTKLPSGAVVVDLFEAMMDPSLIPAA